MSYPPPPLSISRRSESECGADAPEGSKSKSVARPGPNARGRFRSPAIVAAKFHDEKLNTWRDHLPIPIDTHPLVPLPIGKQLLLNRPHFFHFSLVSPRRKMTTKENKRGELVCAWGGCGWRAEARRPSRLCSHTQSSGCDPKRQGSGHVGVGQAFQQLRSTSSDRRNVRRSHEASCRR